MDRRSKEEFFINFFPVMIRKPTCAMPLCNKPFTTDDPGNLYTYPPPPLPPVSALLCQKCFQKVRSFVIKSV
jgi:hypothetical protein